MRNTPRLAVKLLVLLLSLVLCAAPVWAASAGHVNGMVRDADGNPLPDLLVSLVARGVREALPILTRTDDSGRLSFQDVEAGIYELGVTSSLYENPRGRLIVVEPGETVSVKLVLQALLALGGDQQNLGLRALLRSAAGRRMILRSTPGTAAEESSPYFFDRAALQVLTDTGLGEDSFSFPGSDLAGTTTSFAVQESLAGSGDYLVAGQIHSGSDSSWRIKNVLDYDLGSNHEMRLFLGYGRVSFGQTDFGRGFLGQGDLSQAAASTKILSAGLEDRWNFGDSLSLLIGFELNQVRNHEVRSFLSPNAAVRFQPLEGTQLQVSVASRRHTRSSTLALPDGETVHLSDAVFVSPLGGGLAFGTTRQTEARWVQALGDQTRLELAAFRSQVFGAPVPLRAVTVSGGSGEWIPLDASKAMSQGYRVGMTREFSPNFKATVSYLRAQAPGVDADESGVLPIEASELAYHVRRQHYHGLATEVEAYIPASQTHITALVKAVPSGRPLLSLDTLSDYRDTNNEGINLFVRQLVPVPEGLLGFLGLDFLSAYRLEILLDVRNLTNEEVALLEGARGDMLLVQRPRSVRGGISVKF